MKKVFLLISSMFLLASCGTMGFVSTPSTYKASGKEVSAVKSSINFLSLTPMNAQKQSKILLDELNSKCTDGVTNIRSTVSAKIFIILYFEKLQISGNCK